jgi:hypothetical protein
MIMPQHVLESKTVEGQSDFPNLLQLRGRTASDEVTEAVELIFRIHD